MHETPAVEAAAIIGMCEEEGFGLAGVAALGPSPRGGELREWLGAGKHGEMAWLAETVEDRIDPSRLLIGARSAVMVADFYAPRGAPAEAAGAGVGRIARYARGRDYHDVLKRRVQRVCDRTRDLYPGAATRAFCDTAPVPERELAALCGMGWIGKHTLLIHPTHGSWMVLGGFLTTLELAPSVGQASEPDRCGTCTRCIDACPTDAISPYSVDARRCISYLTIEHQAPVEPALGDLVGDWLVGCDICQEVCPHNSPRPGAGASGGGGVAVRGEYVPRRSGFDLLDVLGWDEATRRGRFATSAMKRVTLAQMKRNAILVIRASLAREEPPPSDAILRLRDIAWDASEPVEVRELASMVLAEAGAA